MRTNQINRLATSAFLLGLMFGVPGPASAGLVLTGLFEFSSDASGNGSLQSEKWNTLGGDPIYDLWVIKGGIGGPFINGPKDSQASIAVPLPVGDYTFTLHGDPVLIHAFHGLNLFFNGDNTNPGISVFAATQTLSTPPPIFADSSTTFTLDGQLVPGAATLSFVDGTTTATLTSYSWAVPSVYSTDRVSPFSAFPNGTNDFVGQFTLSVTTAVPEPSTLTLLCLGVVGSVAYGWRQWKSAGSAARCPNASSWLRTCPGQVKRCLRV
jgi:hypothetical protein